MTSFRHYDFLLFISYDLISYYFSRVCLLRVKLIKVSTFFYYYYLLIFFLTVHAISAYENEVTLSADHG